MKTFELPMEATLMFISLFGPNIGYSQKNTRDEQGVKNQLKGLDLISSTEPLEQL